MKRKATVALLTVAMMTALTACGGAKETPATTAAPTAPEQAQAEVTSESKEGKAQEANAASGTVMLYSSMQEDQLVAIKEGFEKK